MYFIILIQKFDSITLLLIYHCKTSGTEYIDSTGSVIKDGRSFLNHIIFILFIRFLFLNKQGVGIRVASFPSGSHWPAGLLTRLWLAAPISIFPSDWLWSLSAVCGLDTSSWRLLEMAGKGRIHHNHQSICIWQFANI